MARRRDATRRLAYAALATALAVVVVVISHFSPARIVPLVFASLAFYIAFVRSGPALGIVTLIATVLICFFMTGIDATFLFLVVLFAPYSVAAYLMRRLSYRVTWQAIVRLAVSAVLFAAAITALFFMSDYVAGTSFVRLIGRVGAPLSCSLLVIAALPVDLFFSFAAERIIKLLK